MRHTTGLSYAVFTAFLCLYRYNVSLAVSNELHCKYLVMMTTTTIIYYDDDVDYSEEEEKWFQLAPTANKQCQLLLPEKSAQSALAYGSCNFENFQNISRAHKSSNVLCSVNSYML